MTQRISNTLMNKETGRVSPCFTVALLSTAKGWVEKSMFRTQLELLLVVKCVKCVNPVQKWWNKIQGIVCKLENPCKKVNFSNTTQVWDKKGTNCNSSMEVTFAFRLVLLLQLSLSSLPLIYFDNYFSWLLLFVHALECTFLQEIREKLRPRKFEDLTNSK